MATWKYLKVNDDLSISIVDKHEPSTEYAFKTIEGAIYPCCIYMAIVIDDGNICSIASQNHYISNIEGVRLSDLDSLQDYQDDGMLIKHVKNKLPNPYEERLQPFTAAVVLACLEKSKQDIPLTSADHQKKMTIQRQIRCMVGTEDEISLKKAIELLSYYGLTIQDVIREDLIVGR